jgi:hypothetical protein
MARWTFLRSCPGLVMRAPDLAVRSRGPPPPPRPIVAVRHQHKTGSAAVRRSSWQQFVELPREELLARGRWKRMPRGEGA